LDWLIIILIQLVKEHNCFLGSVYLKQVAGIGGRKFRVFNVERERVS